MTTLPEAVMTSGTVLAVEIGIKDKKTTKIFVETPVEIVLPE